MTHKVKDLGIKIDVPEFDGRLQPDDFIDWLCTVGRVFELKDIPNDKRVKLVAIKLKKHVSVWWENLKRQREREGRRKIKTWDKMCRELKHKFLPEHYRQDTFIKFHNLKQKLLSVEEYTIDFEELLMKCDIQEPEEQTIARYFGGLNTEVSNVIQLQPYWTLDDVIRLFESKRCILGLANQGGFMATFTIMGLLTSPRLVGNGVIEHGLGGCEEVEILVQGISIVEDFLVMELGRYEVVLGARCIASLGKFEGDYNALSLSWMLNGKKVTLHGDPSLGRSRDSAKVTLNALRNNEEGFLVTPVFIADSIEAQLSVSSATLAILQQFEDVFQSPYSLPPQRTHDHAIVLKDGVEIPNIRPYRYPHY
ncbi:uncharacterized protein [Arachis hypogaea]|uniref:uncharacterized protein n=1 Tax=Arachis hypogaea TaxID=3818 RepID=UPI003B21F5EF